MRETVLKFAIENGIGCCYCRRTNGRDLVFSLKYDTTVHKTCAIARIFIDDNDKKSREILNEIKKMELKKETLIKGE